MLHHVENHIEKMRGKPHHVKKQYAFSVSLGVTAIIFVFWLASFGVGASRDVVAKKVESPVSAMTASVSDAFKYAKELFFGANKTTYSSDNVEVVGGK